LRPELRRRWPTCPCWAGTVMRGARPCACTVVLTAVFPPRGYPGASGPSPAGVLVHRRRMRPPSHDGPTALRSRTRAPRHPPDIAAPRTGLCTTRQP
jgi:hypothetical protein